MAGWKESDLNDDQQAAIDQPGSVFLIACPGSGKTRTLTFKVASELAKLDGHRRFVAAITYTHRAADEIEERIQALGVDTAQLWIGTIHSFCLEWILKPYGLYHPDLAHGFSVINSHESELILQRLCAGHSGPNIKTFDCDYFFTDGGIQLGSQTPAKHENIRLVLADYFQELAEARQVDYEHLLKYAFEILRDNPAVSVVLSKLFSFFAIDEYQDTKQIQYSILGSILRAGEGGVRCFIVGDPNQAIFTSLGGYAIAPRAFADLCGFDFTELELSKNYRSAARIIEYFNHFQVQGTSIEAGSPSATYSSLVTLDTTTTREDLESEIARLIRLNVNDLGILPNQICVIAPWWIHLAHMTRKLVATMPEFEFDGPGLVPFSKDIDNFWYRVGRIALTNASPEMFTLRLRWAREILDELTRLGLDVSGMTSRTLLRLSNSISIDESDGLTYLGFYFEELFVRLRIDVSLVAALSDQRDAFFASSRERVDRLVREGAAYVSDISTFRRVFRQRTGITVSTIHGVKGGEFDTVIAFAMLDGMVPHFNDASQLESANKLLYVIASRARKNLHLLAERERSRGGSFGDYEMAVPLRQLQFHYDPSPTSGVWATTE